MQISHAAAKHFAASVAELDAALQYFCDDLHDDVVDQIFAAMTPYWPYYAADGKDADGLKERSAHNGTVVAAAIWQRLDKGWQW